jgi:predicted metalloprotease with PDZ domain
MPKFKPTPVAQGPHYQIAIADLHSHRFAVTLTICNPAANQEVALPVWIPGSYLVREFAKHLQGLTARQAGKAVSVTQ